jgi:hypothetical protein
MDNEESSGVLTADHQCTGQLGLVVPVVICSHAGTIEFVRTISNVPYTSMEGNQVSGRQMPTSSSFAGN